MNLKTSNLKQKIMNQFEFIFESFWSFIGTCIIAHIIVSPMCRVIEQYFKGKTKKAIKQIRKERDIEIAKIRESERYHKAQQ